MEWSVQYGAAGRSILHSLFISCFISNMYLSLHLSFIHSHLLPLSSSMMLASFLPFPTFLSIRQGLPPFVLALFASAVVFFYRFLFSVFPDLFLSDLLLVFVFALIGWSHPPTALNDCRQTHFQSAKVSNFSGRRKISSTTRSWDPWSLFPSLSCSFLGHFLPVPSLLHSSSHSFIQSLYPSVSSPQVSLPSQLLPCFFYTFI